jgi:hypothetical protein
MQQITIKRPPAISSSWGWTESVNIYHLYGALPGSYRPLYAANEKQYPSNNPIVWFGKTAFRMPRPYFRFIRTIDKAEHSQTNRALAYTIPGSDTTGIILMSNWSTFWTNNNMVLDTNLESETINRALNKLASRKASLGVSMGESVKAASSLASSAITVFRALKAFKRGRFKEVEKILGLQDGQVLTGLYPANKWLEYQYGWKPLLTDLHAQYGIITSGLKDEKAFLLSGKSSQMREYKYTDTVYESSPRITNRRDFKVQVLVQSSFYATMSSASWRAAGQIGLLNPLEVAWELLPFSFVFDWFMPVGNVLEAMTARAGLTYVSGCTTFTTAGDINLRAISSTNVLYKKGHVHLNVFFTNRKVRATWPRPTFYLDDSPFSNSRTLNALALWRSLNSGRGIPSHIRA